MIISADNIANKEKENEQNCRSIIREFSLNTTAHGLPGIARSESIHNRVYWSIALLAFTGFMIYLIVLAIMAYFQYPSQMDLSIDSERPQYFPAFSFCNVGGVRLDLLEGPLFDYINILSSMGLINTNASTFDPFYLVGSFKEDILNNNYTMDPFFYPLSTMLVSCSFNSQPCSTEDFISFVTTTYGMCYTFNAKLKNESMDQSLRIVDQSGSVNKLELGLYVHSHQYVRYLTTGVGMISIIHDNRQAPYLDTSGFNLIPGRNHIFSYRKKKTFFLPSPYTSCTDNLSPWMRTMFENYPSADYKYSKNLCLRLSLQMFLYNRCGCVNPYTWDVRHIASNDTNDVIQAPLCKSDGVCFNNAMSLYRNMSIDSDTFNSECPQECSLTEFITKKSSLLAPAEWQMNDIKKFVENSTVPLPSNWSTEWRNYIHSNYLAVTVVSETNTVENHTQKASTSVIDLLSNIGGQTGLWIGISLLSIMEVIEMIYRLIRYQCCRIQAKVRVRQQVMTY